MIKKITLPVFVLLITLFGLSISNASEAAAADTAKWYTHVYIDNGQLKVDWVVEIGHVTSNPQTWHVVKQSVTPLKCKTTGNLQVNQDHIFFDGQSGFKCEVPSFAEEVKKLSAGAINLEPTITTQSVLTELDAELGFSRGVNSNPIFLIERNLSMNIPHTKGKTNMFLHYPSGQTTSGAFFSSGRSQYNIEQQCNTSTCVFEHALGSSIIQNDSAPFDILLPTGETALYVGYAPNSRMFLSGQIYDLFVDPFARGPGSG
ncbi:MAG: hypothetical protein AAF902_10885 [Chloroflexota bacterium]